MDLYLINTIMNGFWYLFTILFVLYRFTTFFTYLYNFIRFCSKLLNGISYFFNTVVLSYFNKKRGYVKINDEEDIEEQRLLNVDDDPPEKTLYTLTKDYIKDAYKYIKQKLFGKREHQNPDNEIYEERVSSTNFKHSIYNKKQTQSSFNISENGPTLLDQQYNKKATYFESIALHHPDNDNEIYEGDDTTPFKNLDSEEERILHSSIFSHPENNSNFNNLMNTPVKTSSSLKLSHKDSVHNQYYGISSKMLMDSAFIKKYLYRDKNTLDSNFKAQSNLSKNLMSTNEIHTDIGPTSHSRQSKSPSPSTTSTKSSSSSGTKNLKGSTSSIKGIDPFRNEEFVSKSKKFITDPYESQFSRNPYI